MSTTNWSSRPIIEDPRTLLAVQKDAIKDPQAAIEEFCTNSDDSYQRLDDIILASLKLKWIEVVVLRAPCRLGITLRA